MQVIENYERPSVSVSTKAAQLLTLSRTLDPLMAQKGALSLLLLLAFFACARTHITRAEWPRMTAQDKRLYVLTLLGHEKAKERKGGSDRLHPLTAEEYVKRIDAAYARGDRRDVDTIFEGLGISR